MYKDHNLKAFENKDEIFAHVKRDETSMRKNKYLRVQEELRKQIDEFNQRKVEERKVSNNP